MGLCWGRQQINVFPNKMKDEFIKDLTINVDGNNGTYCLPSDIW